MAVTTTLNVIKMTATADVVSGRSLRICGIKAVEQAGAVASITLTANSVVVWEAKLVALGSSFDNVEINGADSLTLAITGSANVYLYSE